MHVTTLNDELIRYVKFNNETTPELKTHEIQRAMEEINKSPETSFLVYIEMMDYELTYLTEENGHSKTLVDSFINTFNPPKNIMFSVLISHTGSDHAAKTIRDKLMEHNQVKTVGFKTIYAVHDVVLRI